ncbi:MAG: ribonuclease P protein component [Pseudomonadota bacterium]
MDRLKKRAEFVETAKGARLHAGAFSLQARRRGSAGGGPRFGFTVTKKTGNAVERNRIRRRLKAAATQVSMSADAGIDYVLIGRRRALSVSYDQLCDSLEKALLSIDPDKLTRRKPSKAADKTRQTQGT